jgi:hypothetical protein
MSHTFLLSSSQSAGAELEWSSHPEVCLTAHARKRGAQRNLSAENLRYILAFGREYQRTGVTFVVLRRCDIPREDLRDPKVARLAGAIALVSADGAIITVYRNAEAARAIVRKMKYRISWKAALARMTRHSAEVGYSIRDFESPSDLALYC